MKYVIAGTRKIKDYNVVAAAIAKSGVSDQITEVLCGASEQEYGEYMDGKREANVDILGALWARVNLIPVKHFEAHWDNLDAPGAILRRHPNTNQFFNSRAGPDRNQEMVDEADGLILIWDGESSGSADVKRRAKRKGIKPFEEIVKCPPGGRKKKKST